LLASLAVVQAKGLIVRRCDDLVSSVVEADPCDVPRASRLSLGSVRALQLRCIVNGGLEDFGGLEFILGRWFSAMLSTFWNQPTIREFVNCSVDAVAVVELLAVCGIGGMSVKTRWRSLNGILIPSMADDESAKLWKVNRTIHELVHDRVRCSFA